MTTLAADCDLLVAAPNPALDSYYVVPELAAGAVQRATDVRHTAGGKGNNLARAAVCLGGRVLSVGILGGGTGDRILRELAREGIAAVAVPGQAETRQCITIVRQDGGENTVVLEAGTPLAVGEDEAFTGAVLRHAPQAACLVLNGSLPPGMPRDAFGTLIARLRWALPDLPLALDTSGEALRLGAWAGPTLVKVNAEELTQAFGLEESWSVAAGQRVAANLQARGVQLLIVTDGPRGACAFAAGGAIWQAQTPVTRWVSAAGAGDSFLAALLLAQGRGAPLHEALAEASAAAAASLQHIVCGQIDLADYRVFLQSTRVEPLTQQVIS